MALEKNSLPLLPKTYQRNIMKQRFLLYVLALLTITIQQALAMKAPDVKGMVIAADNNLNLTGVVRDQKGEPIIGATVCLEYDGKRNGTVTDFDGRFKLSANVENKRFILTASYIGCKTARYEGAAPSRTVHWDYEAKLVDDSKKSKKSTFKAKNAYADAFAKAFQAEEHSAQLQKSQKFVQAAKNATSKSNLSFSKLSPKQWYQKGQNYYYGKYGVTKDYAQALECYLKAAEQGHAEAQASAAYQYYNGEGTALDYDKAVYWYQKAAGQNITWAQANLAECYYYGRGTTKNHSKSFSLALTAAEKNSRAGAFRVAYQYSHGDGVPQDYEKALMWYLKAAEQGSVAALYNIGVMCVNGQGISKDIPEGMAWYAKAADKGDEDSKKILAELYNKGYKSKPATTLTSENYLVFFKSSNSDKKAYTPTYKNPRYVKQTNLTEIAPTLQSTQAKSYETSSQSRQRRAALVIGNGNYQRPLQNAPNDAKDMRQKLGSLGFDTKIGGLNISRKGDMEQKVRDFCRSYKDYDALVFYYSGHGCQYDGENYLLPTESNIQTEADFSNECVSLKWIVNTLKTTKAQYVFVILDACRDTPQVAAFTRGSNEVGLARMSNTPSGFFIGFATQSGQVASDGKGQRNSPYTKALLQMLDKKGMIYADMFRSVRKMVARETHNKQLPINYDQILSEEDFIFNLNR